MLLQLPALAKVPGAHGVVQSPSPQFGAVVGNVYAAGPICVALELPMKAKQGGVNLGNTKLAASEQKGKLRPRKGYTICPWSLSELTAEPGLSPTPLKGHVQGQVYNKGTSLGGHSVSPQCAFLIPLLTPHA